MTRLQILDAHRLVGRISRTQGQIQVALDVIQNQRHALIAVDADLRSALQRDTAGQQTATGGVIDLQTVEGNGAVSGQLDSRASWLIEIVDRDIAKAQGASCLRGADNHVIGGRAGAQDVTKIKQSTALSGHNDQAVICVCTGQVQLAGIHIARASTYDKGTAGVVIQCASASKGNVTGAAAAEGINRKGGITGCTLDSQIGQGDGRGIIVQYHSGIAVTGQCRTRQTETATCGIHHLDARALQYASTGVNLDSRITAFNQQ